ncbi:MAG TPA: DUF1847 domain-containing protein [Caldisericia bacterium]|nr:DUF1847 domain-containing protein [Caldisericia bacterium]HPF49895.1 DUF1847 domain-containing protein [Caldisericia bacterium]HPI84698.1 DUF1847 domain-containing protein [Caldisericia bacterium]HPQ93930.1 DUF1847 domain-containing protein [Caldisericia bacterium]HRV75728.1 DUF1847 domain-containing protein [Caldisericia bacterium]
MNCLKCTTGRCSDCEHTKPFREESLKIYKTSESSKIHSVAADVEVSYHSRLTRLEELIMFAEKIGYKRIGIAYCGGLTIEARTASKIIVLRGFQISSAMCGVCGLDRKELGIKSFRADGTGPICNPVGQALALNSDNTELNIIVGLCVGHDILFTQYSKAPVSTFIVKDRVLGHNPVQAVYSKYVTNQVVMRMKKNNS